MKLVKAIFRPEKFQQVKAALAEKGFYAMTVTEVRGRGEQKGIALQYRGGQIAVDLLPKIKIEMVVQDTYAQSVVHIIREAAWTGKMGDGKIFILPVELMVRVRDDETMME
jgi:nitrogen regulatory protein P-II 1